MSPVHGVLGSTVRSTGQYCIKGKCSSLIIAVPQNDFLQPRKVLTKKELQWFWQRLCECPGTVETKRSVK